MPETDSRIGKVEQYRQVILAKCPEFTGVDAWELNQEGQYNDGVVVDRAFIFRFPRYVKGIELMRREVAFLQAMGGRMTLPVPEPVFTNLERNEPGEVFMGYRLLLGEPLWRPAIFAEEDERVLDMWARQLAGFLKELHALAVEPFLGEWSMADRLDEWEALYGNIRTHLFPLMRPDARRDVTSHFESFLDDASLHDFQPAPRHGDYGSGNILFDLDTKRITGIIDFGFAEAGDPAIDIAAVMTLGEALFGRFVETYPAVESMLPRANFYRGTYALMEALHGFESGDREAFDAGMAAYI